MNIKNIITEIRASSAKTHSAEAKGVQKLLRHLQIKDIRCEMVSQIYRMEGTADTQQIEKISQELLCDPVTESYLIDAAPTEPNTFFADVWYKPGVTDAVGESVLKAIKDLGIDSVEKAYSGKRYEFKLKGAEETPIIEFIEKQVMNPLIQEYRILKSSPE